MSSPFKIETFDTAAEFYRDFLAKTPQKKYLFGINEYARNIAELVDIDGFIDDYTDMTSWIGKPILRLKDVAPDSLVVSCVTQARPITALQRLHEAGIRKYGDYFSFADASAGRLPQTAAIDQTRSDHREHADQYQWVRQHLNDDESRRVFDHIMDFRLNGNLQAMTDFEYAADRQYFEPFAPLREGEVFVDGGGFDGFTSHEFAIRCPQYGAIHLFEPSPAALEKSKAKLSKQDRIHYHPVGLYDRTMTLSFDANAGSASRISENGSETINVARLDDAVHDPVSFIKLDLEGAELHALKGSEHHIRHDHPKLAVAVYHHPSDFWKIPEYVLGLRNDYRLYLRHYTEGWTETVMFFIPR